MLPLKRTRAGEAGRGFAVVAVEVKALAQESKTSAEKIEEMISTLNKSTKKAAVAMDDTHSLVIKGTTMSTEAFDAFQKIKVAAEGVANSVSEVAGASEQQAAAVEEITASVQEVRIKIEGTAKEAKEAAEAAEEATVAIDEVNKVVVNVNAIAESVSREMAKFTL